MYRCDDCGYIFETPKRYTETHGLDTPPYEHFSGCPLCGSSYEELKDENEDEDDDG